MKKQISELQKVTKELLSLMSTNAEAEVTYNKQDEVFLVNVDAGEETGLLIGKKGDTLTSLQTLLALLLKQKTDEWKRVVVNVGDYREKEEDYLRNLAATAVSRVKETGEPQNLYNLKPWQRRVVHLSLSEDPEISSESEGEGEERHLVIKLKK